ncbi:hypothetical protein BSL78_03601 [Apostichopus japonicus]|uniref:LIM zinc-binding domain-containing protein n=1 Tax=Stichopus japonicus TaxID=307972 RepID=A0A2G8LGT3_STIJA|nr:hypothetical protein BSL78_03601 [Apostichopus japonicus]
MPCNFFPIYLTAEKYTAMGKDWHRGCFKCTECKSSIAQGAESVHLGKPYCKTCYAKVHGPKGVHSSGASQSYVHK